MQHTVTIEGMKFYAYHGCLEEEALIGGNYIVDVYVTMDFTEAAKNDDLTKTVDYCLVYELCKKEMMVRSKLIEQVCLRMHDSLRKEFKNVNSLRVKLTKLAPPVNGDVASASAEIKD
jgi:7,8-dihydroneopterin aldolase/epimerase/oxygenase